MCRMYSMGGKLVNIKTSGSIDEIRATEKDYCYLLYSDRPTQGAKGTRTRILDYVFMSKSLGESGMVCLRNNSPVENYSVTDGSSLT